jgi:hypothetical protein
LTSTGTSSFSANPTFSGGTANGVAYLNGSKVVTSGSALTFDGTTTTTPKVVTSATSGLVANWNAGLNDNQIYGQVTQSLNNLQYGVFSGGTAFLASGNNYPLTFYINSSEQMRLTSTGLGIGTSSPATRLAVASAVGTGGGLLTLTNTSAFANNNSIQIDFNGNNANGGMQTFAAISAYNQFAIGNNYGNIAFRVANAGSIATAMLLDYQGNLGLGVTPSAWSGLTAFELGAAGSQNFCMYGGGILRNAYYNGTNFIYKATAAATLYEHSAGAHRWYNAPSGTAGNAITFTQAMTLDAAGKLGVGTTGPNETIQAAGTVGSIAASGSNGLVVGDFGSDAGTYSINAVSGRALRFYDAFAGAERARIDSSGNLIQTVNTTAATLTTNQTLTFSIVDNSTLRISVRGSDGTTRTATVALT